MPVLCDAVASGRIILFIQNMIELAGCNNTCIAFESGILVAITAGMGRLGLGEP